MSSELRLFTSVLRALGTAENIEGESPASAIIGELKMLQNT